MLKVEDLDVFHGDARALDGVSLDVAEGAIVAIVGANGAGKTSLIRTIAGMHKPARGRIVLRGADIAGLPSFKVCNLGIGQVAEGRLVFPTLTVSENLEMGAMLPRARALQKRNMDRVLAMFPVLASRILVLHHGAQIAQGTPEQVVREKAVIESYLGTEAVG